MSNDPKRFEDPADPTQELADAASAPGEGSAPASETEIATLKAQVADLTDRMLRAHAEMENIRKRSEREKAETHKYAVTRFARDIIAVGDNVQRAIAAVPVHAAEQDPALQSFLEGVRMTERELVIALERHGVRRMDVKGEAFNPHHHQAVMEAQDESVPAGTIVQVLQEGYVIEDRVLRPAMVAVAKGGPKPVKENAAASRDSPAAADDDEGPESGAEPAGQQDPRNG